MYSRMRIFIQIYICNICIYVYIKRVGFLATIDNNKILIERYKRGSAYFVGNCFRDRNIANEFIIFFTWGLNFACTISQFMYIYIYMY